VRVVLVHGTTQSPAGWDLLAAELRGRGNEVIAVDLVGVDPQSPANAYAETVAAKVPTGCDVVVADSGAGLLLSTISSALSASREVYLAAAIPNGVVSFVDEIGADPTRIVHRDWIGVDPMHRGAAARADSGGGSGAGHRC
jgi:pimeloyl-ACP methyl ester carboxylesterase